MPRTRNTLTAAFIAALSTGFGLVGAGIGAGPSGSASAGGIGASIGSGPQASASVTSAGEQNAERSGVAASGPAGTVGSLDLRLSAGAEGATSKADGSLAASTISLLGGRLRVESLRMAIHAEGAPASLRASVADYGASGVVIDGTPTQVGPGTRIDIGGVATATFFEHVSDGAASIRANALRVEVTSEASGLPVGTQLVVGHLEASAEAGELPPVPAPSETPAAATIEAPPVALAPAAPTPAPSPAPVKPRASQRGASPDPGLPQPRATRITPDGRTGEGPEAPRVTVEPEGASASTPRPLPDPVAAPDTGAFGDPWTLPRLPAPAVTISPTQDGYVFPVYGRVSFSDDYGAPRAVTGWHQGNDIFGPEGLPVLAVADGTLSLVGVNALGGNRLWLTDSRGNQFYYAHLSAYAPGVENGTRVQSGQVIGFLGNTGQAITTPPHLHFEVHPGGGDSINPYPYMIAWSRQADVPLAFKAAAIAPGSAPAAGALLIAYQQTVEEPIGPGDGLADVVP